MWGRELQFLRRHNEDPFVRYYPEKKTVTATVSPTPTWTQMTDSMTHEVVLTIDSAGWEANREYIFQQAWYIFPPAGQGGTQIGTREITSSDFVVHTYDSPADLQPRI